MLTSCRAHVKSDLEAYVCLFEDCNTPEELYNHSGDWIKHMREHALRWRCNSKSHGECVFVTRDDYLEHISNVHRGAFTDAQLAILAERNARTIGPLFESCPLCGVRDVKGLMEDHIVGHLRFIALKSLPPYQDEGSEGSRSERSSLENSKVLSRSTIKKHPDRYLELTFDDDYGDQQSSAQQRHDGKSTTQSPYEEWGGYRDYISKFPAGLKNSSLVAARFPPPFISDDETSSTLTPWMDPSTDFVEESLFIGVLKSDQRRFEWGFVTEAHGSPQNLENDSIIQTLLKSKQEKSSHEARVLAPTDNVIARSVAVPTQLDSSAEQPPTLSNESRYDAERTEHHEEEPKTPPELRPSPEKVAEKADHDRILEAQMEIARNEILKSSPGAIDEDQEMEEEPAPVVEGRQNIDDSQPGAETRMSDEDEMTDRLTKEASEVVHDTAGFSRSWSMAPSMGGGGGGGYGVHRQYGSSRRTSSVTPSFLFQVNRQDLNEDTQAGGLAPQTDSSGFWYPPVYAAGFGFQHTGTLYRWENGVVTRATDAHNNGGLTLYRAVTMFYCNNFYRMCSQKFFPIPTTRIPFYQHCTILSCGDYFLGHC
jgi:hypothetical protein